ncbi:hypothetical protein COLO4_34074 [Corchorus olitorius]|uniref:Uncharacterized protein n=1 Tax=Corchorus olitorius TaxID=93759 RepID=A0A1R3GNY8_9ROSI|nr:hypothetical protein COLO4_34074 [Corchorus olitorius]
MDKCTARKDMCYMEKQPSVDDIHKLKEVGKMA